MPSSRYTVVISRTGTPGRSFSISLRAVACSLAALCVSPLLVGWGAHRQSSDELARLRAGYDVLLQENLSFRAATGQLTDQIAALQTVVAELGERSTLDPAAAGAIAKLPPVIRNRAMGGASIPAPAPSSTLLSAAVTSPENTFGVLRELLGLLESRLQNVRGDVDRWHALGRATPSIWPALGWITGSFGRRSDPFTGDAAQHQGLDIAGDKGQPVFATADGTVQQSGWTGDFGNLVILSHEFGLMTRYGHLARSAVRPGAHVRRGDIIGYMGTTGRSSGPHLHYEVWANGRPVNPLKLLTSTGKR